MQIYFFLHLRQNIPRGKIMNFKDYIKDVPDFPSKGIIFKDITPLLLSPEAFKNASNALLEMVSGLEINKVVGVESRGFFFAPWLAHQLNAGFIPARKPGKLPRKTARKEYALEYGTDSLEMHSDSIQPGDRVLLHDDVLATGGTAKAVCDLIESLGGKVVQCNFLIELEFLMGRTRLEAVPVASLITY
jgi:adenine phosphoribosyltransferase